MCKLTLYTFKKIKIFFTISHQLQISINFSHKSTLIYPNPNNLTFLLNHSKSSLSNPPPQFKHTIKI